MAKRTCLLCQTKYDYCPHCPQDLYKPKWMMLFHDDNCQKIFDTLQRNEQHLDTDEESIAKLKSCDLSVLKNATEAINNQVNAILSKEKKTQNTENKKEADKPSAKKNVNKSIVKEN